MEPIKTQLTNLLKDKSMTVHRNKWKHSDNMRLRAMFNAGRTDDEVVIDFNKDQPAYRHRTIKAVAKQRSILGLVKFRKRKKRAQKWAAIAPAAAKAPIQLHPTPSILANNDLRAANELLKQLGYKLAVVKLEQ